MSRLVQHSPKALRHYREQLGLSREFIAKKAGLKNPDKLLQAESSNKPVLTHNQLKSIAHRLLVPEFYLLTDALETLDIPQVIDHRNHADSDSQEVKYQLSKAIFELVKSREDILYIYESTDTSPEPFVLKLTGDDAQADAQAIRNYLGVSTARLTQGGNDYYHAWRGLLEQKDILVFEIPRTSIASEGMALHYDSLPIIGILSSGQAHSRRLFTMIHELVHLGLRQSAVDGLLLQSNQALETYCNRVAGLVLLPAFEIDRLYKPYLSLSDNIDCIRTQLKVSRQSIAIQLKLMAYITQEMLDDYLTTLDSPAGFGRMGAEYTAYNRFGKYYIQRVLAAATGDDISISTAMNMLNLRNIDQLQYLQEKVFA